MKQYDAPKNNSGSDGEKLGQWSPVLSTISIIQGKWTLHILRDLIPGKKRFGELRKAVVGITPKTLSVRLRELEKAGVVHREFFPEVPPRVEYRLTPKGEQLGELIGAMAVWGTKWREENQAFLRARAEEKKPSPVPKRDDFMFID
ncbi:MAG: helix-turn-helix transcriptional regulator [Nitrospinae bacterium]|nr:helix-turn-helix transcriptional regulator [Nitrospinota bacterium]